MSDELASEMLREQGSQEDHTNRVGSNLLSTPAAKGSPHPLTVFALPLLQPLDYPLSALKPITGGTA